MTTIVYNRMTQAFFERTGAVTINLTNIFSSRRTNLEKELSKVHAGTRVIVEFGGDNCRFNWKNISRNVNGIHLPKTSIEDFHDAYMNAISAIRAKGGCPVLLGLAPIDSERYFNYIADGKNREKIISWLGGNYLYLANIHSQYVEEVKRIAEVSESGYIDTASIFRKSSDYNLYLSEDGISLSQAGYLRVQALVQDAI